MSMYSVKGLKREYTQTSGISYEVSEDTSNIGGTYLQAKFSEIGIQPMTFKKLVSIIGACLLYTSPSPRDATLSRMPSSA